MLRFSLPVIWLLVALVGEARTRVRVGDGHGSHCQAHQAHPLDAQEQAHLPRGGGERHPTTRTYIHPSLYPPFSLSILLSIYSALYPSFSLSTLLSIHPSLYPPSLYPSFSLSTLLSIHPSLFILLSIHEVVENVIQQFVYVFSYISLRFIHTCNVFSWRFSLFVNEKCNGIYLFKETHF